MLNKKWHLKHKFPNKETEEEKDEWRTEHRKNCDCGKR
jgi:hypothetical protein